MRAMPSAAGFPYSRNNYCMFEHLHTRVSSGESVACRNKHTHTHIEWHLWGNMHSHSRCVAWRPAARINFATTTTTIAATKGGIITCECLGALCGDTDGRRRHLRQLTRSTTCLGAHLCLPSIRLHIFLLLFSLFWHVMRQDERTGPTGSNCIDAFALV